MCTGTHPFIPVPHVFKCEMIYLSNGQRVENVLHFDIAGEIDIDTPRRMADAINSAYGTTLAAVQNENTTLTLIRVQDLSSEGSFLYERGAGASGLLLGAGVPGNVTIVTKFGSGLSGRSTRGRVYNVGLDQGQVAGNQIGSVDAGLISAAWVDFVTAVNADFTGAAHVVVSYCGGGTWRTEGLVTAVQTYTTELNLDSQRRRLTGRGL